MVSFWSGAVALVQCSRVVAATTHKDAMKMDHLHSPVELLDRLLKPVAPGRLVPDWLLQPAPPRFAPAWVEPLWVAPLLQLPLVPMVNLVWVAPLVRLPHLGVLPLVRIRLSLAG